VQYLIVDGAYLSFRFATAYNKVIGKAYYIPHIQQNNIGCLLVTGNLNRPARYVYCFQTVNLLLVRPQYYSTTIKRQACYNTGTMSTLLFGTAGIPFSTQPQTTIDGIRCVAELGLDCMELEFVQGVYLDESAAREVAKAAQSYEIKLSAHAPYYLNFNAHETKKLKASQEYLLKAARIASLCNAHSVVFHAGFYLGDPPESTYQTILKYLAEVMDRLKEEGIHLLIRPEVSGKASQFGSLDEILRLCAELEGTAPCIDFAHWHARSGENNSYEEFASALESVRQKLGDASLKNMHLHISGIEYGAKGERRHLELEQSDLKYIELMQALKDYAISGTVICESPIQEEDALRLQAAYGAFGL